VVLAVAVALAPAAAVAQINGPSLDVPVGGSRHMKVGVPIARVSVAGNGVADVTAFPPDDILVTGKKLGETELTAWDKSGEVHTFVVRVTIPIEGLRDRLHLLFPEQKIGVQAIGASLILTGQVNDLHLVEDVEKVALGYLTTVLGDRTQPQITNLLQVVGSPQVQLEVRFCEVSRSALREMGVNLWTRTGRSTGDVTGALLNPANGPGSIAPDPGSSQLQLPLGTSNTTDGLPIISNPLAGAFSLVLATAANSSVPLTATLSLLSEHGFSKTLAEPTLVAMSGQDASFLVGGELPIPLSGALGQVSVTFKKFGVQLQFTPYVIAEGQMQLKLEAVVSDVDPSIGVKAGSVDVPGLTTRASSTTIRLKDGQSFAIAGLLSDKLRSVIDKVPGLGDLPVIGALFRSTSFQRSETELLITVTAHIVSPVPKGEHIPLPGEDEVSDPNDLELFLLGDGEERTLAPAGKVGFIK
jgi:pilus assembly protein CpaC